jgi:glycolate oxidase FAD binding subunit
VTIAATDLAAALGTLLGAAAVDTNAASCAAHAVHGRAPALVATPGSATELAAALQLTREHGLAVVPWGGGTAQAIGGPLTHGDTAFIVLKTVRLTRIIEHEPADLTISVEAGLTLGALRAHLAQHGQILPLDPALPERTTIGGLIAAAADGPRRLGYGTLRDLLIGIMVADTAGRLTKAGGMVVKNVSGFDMMKLYLGSFGTLAVITSANFKLLPAPRAAGAALAHFSDARPLLAFLDALAATQLTPVATEVLNAAALRALDLAGTYAVALRTEGLPAAVARHQHELAALASQHGATVVTSDLARWEQIAALPQTAALAPDEAVLKLTHLPADLGEQLAVIERLAPDAQLSARALSGVLYVRLRNTSAAQIQAIAAASGGLQWTATPLADAPRWGTVPGLDLMQRIKREFDPTGTLNPGRFVAGL